MPERPTVALVAHGVHEQGGMERAFYELVSRAHDRYRFVVVSARLDERLRPYVEWRRVRVPMRPVPLQLLAFALLAGLRVARIRHAIVHTQGAIIPNRADLASVQFCSAGYVEHGGLVPAARPPLRTLNSAIARLIALALERWCYRPARTRRLAAVSLGIERELERHYPGVAVARTPNGVDGARFRPDPEARCALRRAEGADDGALVVLFVGGDWPRKGLGLALEGVARSGVPARLWVVGAGEEERYAARARSLGVRASFFGPRPDVERFYAAADVFVSPTLYEAMPLAVYEAAASALPLVVTGVNGTAELLEPPGAGILVERDADAVAAALRALTDPELRRRCGEEARRRALAFGWDRSVDAVLSVYRELAA